MTKIILIIYAIVLVLIGYLFYRNGAVHRFRMWLIHSASIGAKADIQAGRAWEWRYDALENGPSYQEMFYKIWRPLTPEEWYPNQSFYKKP